MPFVYDWLTKHQKTNIEEIVLETYDGKVVFQLQCNRRILSEICYERNGPSTLITFEQNELLVPQQFLDVFLEDLKMVLMNQKAVLEYFRISSEETGVSDAKYVLGIEDILRTKTLALSIREIRFDQITASQGMSIIRYLDSDTLNCLVFSVPEPVNFRDFSNGLRNLEEGYKFDLHIGVKTIWEDDVMAINEVRMLFFLHSH
ncbi:hypothetical protein B9Z55_021259 [Caenorhabditis nigoni]|uniref:DUF38 domain-containing protein n=1 Tax=Caenorhabditis nigoni TaxID=1611254 RepID=A0A2G5TR56_9PELO|nr:hypothetical protein B9Z55_021259 [Caenorhabditis nigoni]